MLPHPPKILKSLEPISLQNFEDEIELKNVSLNEASAESPISARNVDISGARFTAVDLYQFRLNKFRAEDFTITGGDLSVVNFSNSTFIRTEFTSTRLTGTNFTECMLEDVVFTSCKLDMATLRYAKFKRVIFRGCDFSETDFSGSSFEHVTFDACTIDKVRFDQCAIKSLDLTTSTIVELYGWSSLKNVIINQIQLIEVSPYLAHELGIKILADESDTGELKK